MVQLPKELLLSMYLQSVRCDMKSLDLTHAIFLSF